jgi:hypothetical protein
MTAIQVRLEITLKFNELPQSKEEQGGARTFEVRGETGPRFVVTLSKKAFKKLTAAHEQYPQWLAVVSGRFGEPLGEGRYRLDNAGLLSVMERKPKGSVEEPKPPAEPGAAPSNTPAPPAKAAAPAAPKPTAYHAPKPKNRRNLLFKADPDETLRPIGRFRSNPTIYSRSDESEPTP